MHVHRMRLPGRSLRLLLILTFVATVPLLVAGSSAGGDEMIDPAMVALWERADRPVANGEADRSWMWGPRANDVRLEPYSYAPLADQDNQRLVAYFDKSRMEINNPAGDPASIWHVTNGRLVWELMTGRVQVGQEPDQFTYNLPAPIPVAGDPYAWPAPTYQMLGRLMAGDEDRTGTTVVATLDGFGNTGADLSPVEQRTHVRYVTYEGPDGAEIGHNIPDVFWSFLTEAIDPVIAPATWLFATGYPLTEAYWTDTQVNATPTRVLVQCFERRCLTYTPTNNDPYKVEMGNVGLHYHLWRYEGYQSSCPTTPVRGFGALWTSNDDVRARIGCPDSWTGGEQGLAASYQQFEHGMMIWINVNDPYAPLNTSVFVLFDDGTFARHENTYGAGDPFNDPSLTPPDGLYQPNEGFGKIWRDVPGLRERLGWATGPDETSTGGAWQRFTFGAMIWLEEFDDIWVLYGDLYWAPTGQWERYDDTFDG